MKIGFSWRFLWEMDRRAANNVRFALVVPPFLFCICLYISWFPLAKFGARRQKILAVGDMNALDSCVGFGMRRAARL